MLKNEAPKSTMQLGRTKKDIISYSFHNAHNLNLRHSQFISNKVSDSTHNPWEVSAIKEQAFNPIHLPEIGLRVSDR